MKKVCMISLSAYPADPRVRREAEVLGENGISVHVICLSRTGEKKHETFGNVEAFRILKIAKKEKLLSYLFFSFSFFLKAFFILQKLFIQNRYSVIQFHNMPDHLVFLGIFQKILGVRIILDIHDLTPELFEEKWPGKKDKFLHKLIKYTEMMSCKFSDKIITVTDECKKRLVSRGVPESKITLVLNTPQKKIFLFDESRSYTKKDNELILLYHGTVAYRFGIHIAVEAIQILRSSIANVRLLVYGKYDPGYKGKLIELVQDLGLGDNIEFGNFITLEEVYQIIKKCDLAVVPYLETDYMHLSLSTKTFEYAAAGIPVVCTKLKEMYNIFGDDSLFFVENLSPKTLAESILAVYNHPEQQKIYAANANKALDRISGETMQLRYLNLISNII